MLIALAIPFFLFVAVTIGACAGVLGRLKEAADRRRFVRLWMWSALGIACITVIATALTYRNEHRYIVNVALFVALGPPIWALAALSFLFRAFARAGYSRAASLYGVSEQPRKEATLRGADLMSALAAACLISIPLSAMLFLSNLGWIAHLVGLEISTP